jgi:3',5'-cyclic AMP phosphodiesterase CpdA
MPRRRRNPADTLPKAAPETRPITIAHISDLHFLSSGYPKLIRNGLRRLKLQYQDETILDAMVIHLRECKPDILVVSGDLTTLGDRASMAEASAFLARLVEACSIHSHDRQIITPGNHDTIQQYFFRRPRAFEQVFTNQRDYRTFDVAGTHLAIFSFDSSIREGRLPRGLFRANKGKVSGRAFNAFNDNLKKEDVPTFKIAILHHHPLPIPYKNVHGLTVMENGGAFIAHMQSRGVNLILHGHEHYPYSCTYRFDLTQHPVIVAAAGACLYDKNNNNPGSFNIIQIHPEDHVSVTQVTYYETGFNPEPPKTFYFEYERPLPGHILP